MDYLAVLLAEYNSVRAESLEALNQIHTVAQYGLASVGVAAGAGLVTSDHDVTAAAIILMGLVPTLIFFGITMMAFAVHRVVQARQYLRLLEAKIAGHFSDPTATLPRWERIRKAKRAAINAYPFAVAATIGAATVIGPGLGGFLLARHNLWPGFAAAETLDLVSIGVFGLACIRMYRKIAAVDRSELAPAE
jgi:hypothetical protein